MPEFHSRRGHVDTGAAEIVTYELDELLGTKLRALYQGRTGRDLFDLVTALEDERTDPQRIITAFQECMHRVHHHVAYALFERNTAAKLSDAQFGADIGPWLLEGYRWGMEQGPRLS